MLDGTYAEFGLATRSFLAGDSRVAGRVVVEAFFGLGYEGRGVLELLVMESRILWNLRFVVLNATDILSDEVGLTGPLESLKLQAEVVDESRVR